MLLPAYAGNTRLKIAAKECTLGLHDSPDVAGGVWLVFFYFFFFFFSTESRCVCDAAICG